MTTAPRQSADAFAGLHKHPMTKKTFSIHYKARGQKKPAEFAGWYWHFVPFDELTDEEEGPFTSSRAAFRHACSKC